jgi:hypothetical protein
MQLISALRTGSEAITLVSALAKLIKEAKGPSMTGVSQTTLSELLPRLQIEAVRLSRDLENRLRNLAERIQEYGLNPAQSLNQQFESLAWYNFIRQSRLKSLREECHSIYRQLTSFLDDATAVLICEGQQQLAAVAFKSGLEAKRDLDRLFLDPNTSLGVFLDGMLATASRVTTDLQAA